MAKTSFKSFLQKINKRIILYTVAGVSTLGVVIPLGVYALNDVKISESTVQGTILLSSSAKKEYLLGQKLDVAGISFEYDNQVMEVEESNFVYDFSTAGKKSVTYSSTIGSITYQGSFYVEVFKATNLDVSGYENITIKSDGTVYAPDIRVVANLSGVANTMQKDPRFPGFDSTCYILSSDQYSITASKSKFDNYYNVVLNAGGCTYGWVNCQKYTIPDISSVDRIVTFENKTPGGSYKLELFCTYSSTGFTGLGVGKNTDVEGIYYLYKSSTEIKQYHFKYRVETWSSYFLSNDTYHEGLVDSMAEDSISMKVEVEGNTFTSSADIWHLGVLG